jgi:hypothetical protein
MRETVVVVAPGIGGNEIEACHGRLERLRENIAGVVACREGADP